jgi:ribosome biogenesis GTPase
MTTLTFDKFTPPAGAPKNAAIVVSLDRSLPMVCSKEGLFRAEYAAGLIKRKNGLVSVGDWVLLDAPKNHDTPLITKVLPRKNVYLRPSTKVMTGEQVFAANIDYVFVVHSLSGRGVHAQQLIRELILALQSDAEVVLVLNKSDIACDLTADIECAKEIAHACKVIEVSSVTLEGIDELRAMLAGGKIAVLMGKSGVGKSALTNALAKASVHATALVRESDDEGRHTTRARSMVEIEDGGIVIDSPGIRSFSLKGAKIGLRRMFSQVIKAESRCKFNDCTHTNEPDCAVIKLHKSGKIPKILYETYLSIVEEVNN